MIVSSPCMCARLSVSTYRMTVPSSLVVIVPSPDERGDTPSSDTRAHTSNRQRHVRTQMCTYERCACMRICIGRARDTCARGGQSAPRPWSLARVCPPVVRVLTILVEQGECLLELCDLLLGERLCGVVLRHGGGGRREVEEGRSARGVCAPSSAALEPIQTQQNRTSPGRPRVSPILPIRGRRRPKT
jgi:hypothetical protein